MGIIKRYKRHFLGTVVFASTIALQGLAGTETAFAINLNDEVAASFGGIRNYWDSENSLPAVVSLTQASYGASFCTGTLINPRTVLTAAHCVVDKDTREISEDFRRREVEVRFSPDMHDRSRYDRTVNGVAVHEDYDPGGFGRHDLALLSLARPVTSIKPVRLYGPDDPEPDYGAPLVMAGYGRAGTGTKPGSISDGKRRIAETVSLGMTRLERRGPPVLAAEFRDPEEPDLHDQGNLTENGVPIPLLQGEPAPGDSGGPLFLVTDEGLIQVGTVVGGTSGYGSLNFWMPVGNYLDWIEGNKTERSAFGMEDTKIASWGEGLRTWVLKTSTVRDSYSVSGSFLWSDDNGWSDGSPSNFSGDFNGWGSLGRYYNATIGDGSAITVDGDPVVDSLVVSGEGASLNIVEDASLTSLLGVGISSGVVTVDGELNSGDFVYLSGGELNGSGLIVAPGGVLNAGGVVAPGGQGAAGVLTVAGSYHQGDEGTLAIDVAANGLDRLDVTGVAVLDGTLAVNGHLTYFNPADRYTVVSAGLGIDGRFAALENDGVNAFVRPAAFYGPHEMSVGYARNGTAFASYAPTHNTRAVAMAAERLGVSSGVYQSIVTTRTADTATLHRSFDLLSGEAHASAVSVGYGQTQALQNALLGHLRGPLAGATADSEALAGGNSAVAEPDAGGFRPVVPVAPGVSAKRFGFWGTGFGAWGKASGNSNVGKLDTSTGGFLVGAETAVGEGYRIGVAGGYERTSFDIDQRLSSGVGESVFGALYGSAQWGAVALRGGASYSYNSTQVHRSVTLPGYGDRTSASYHGRTVSAFGEIGYRMSFGVAQFEPFAGVSGLRLETDGFHERGGSAALWGRGSSYNLGATTVGLRAEAHVSRDLPLHVRGLVGWRHAFGDVSPQALLSFRGGSSFVVSGARVDRDALVAEAGLDWRPNEDVVVGVSYGGQVGKDTQSHTFKGNLSLKF